MFNISIELPSGARSRGFERDTEEKALAAFNTAVDQVRQMKNFTADVILTDIGIEVKREHIDNEKPRM